MGTLYKGRRFRTQAEARWAVFFEVLGIDFQYEPEKFASPRDSEAVSYFLPLLGDEDHSTLRREGLFLDVSDGKPGPKKIKRAIRLCSQTGRDVAIFWNSDFKTGIEFYPRSSRHFQVAFTQCPLCGFIGLSSPASSDDSSSDTPKQRQERQRRMRTNWQDGSPLFSVCHHFCYAECEMAERYNILNYFNQDYLTPALSPILDLAYETAGSVRFELSGAAEIASTAARTAMRLSRDHVYCFPEQHSRVTARALEWAAIKEDFMYYEEPWYMEHKRNIDKGVSPCTCHSCVCNGLQSIKSD